MSSREDSELRESLSSTFQKILDINDELNNSSLPTTDPKYQNKVNDAIERLEDMTKKINSLALFSANETIDEMCTEHLKYFLVPALLADFTMKNLQHDRVDVLQTAEIYYKDFIARLNDYQVCDIELKQKDNDEKIDTTISSTNQVRKQIPIDQLIRLAQVRESKINRYRQMKELDMELQQLKQMIMVQQNNGHSVDEDVERRFYMKFIKRWLNHALDELNTINTEMPMVQMRAAMLKMNKNNDNLTQNDKKPTKPLVPIIITRDRLQKQVYGAGYPSVATYSVDEFVQQKINEGSLKLTDKNVYSNSLYDWATNPDKKKQEEEDNEIRKERLVERDDSIELARMRAWDDWKDDHKRGEGNRHNMG